MKNGPKIVVAVLLASFFSLILMGVTQGDGLAVSPGGFKATEVSIGSRVELPTPLVITWSGSSQAEYQVKVISPTLEESAQDNCPFKYQSSYTQIPSLSWVTFSEDEFTLTPGENKTVKVYLEIPNEERYLGERWEVWLNVTPKPGGEMVGMETFTYLLVETSPTPPPPLWPITLAIIVIACLIAGLIYAIKKGKI